MDEWFKRSEETWDAAHVHLQWAMRRQKANADRHRSEARGLGPWFVETEETERGMLQVTASPRLPY